MENTHKMHNRIDESWVSPCSLTLWNSNTKCTMQSRARSLILSKEIDDFSILGVAGDSPVHRLKKQVVLLIIVLCGCMCLLIQIDFNPTVHRVFQFKKFEIPVPENSSSGFLVNTKGCRILDLDPFDPSLIKYFRNPRPINCDPANKGSLVKATETELYVDQSVAKVFTSGNFTCCFRSFKRKEFSEHENLYFVDNRVVYSVFCTEFSSKVEVKDEFVKVECIDGTGGVIFEDFFSFPQNPYKLGDPEYNNALNQTDKLSLLLLGLDGMSRLNFLRQMPRTLKFFEDRDAISMLGYNKVGYNSLPNLLPVLSGYSLKRIDCWKHMFSGFDNCTFIWDLFKKQGYATAYVEDAPFVGTFWWHKIGFRKKPVDFYPRPFFIEAEGSFGNEAQGTVKFCLRNKPAYQVMNNLTKSFVSSVRNQLTFGFFWANTLGHDFLNFPRLGDGDFERLLRHLEDIGIFNKTMIVLMSDHGIRWGKIRSTYQGFLEERLPFVSFLFPAWFKEKYSTAIGNLRVNAERLTTPFDLHETLRDMLNLTGISNEEINNKPKNDRGRRITGISLFRPISTERTCSDAGIPEEWCTCHTSEQLPISSEETQKAAASIVLKLNSLLGGYRECAALQLSKVVGARQEEVPHNEKLKHSFKVFVVTLETKPGEALFEATVRHTTDTGFVVLGDISRLNMYGNQSSCMPNYFLRLYCYCLSH